MNFDKGQGPVLSDFLTPCTAFGTVMAHRPQAPLQVWRKGCGLVLRLCGLLTLFLYQHCTMLASSKSPFWFSKGSGFLGCSERVVYILDRVSPCSPCWP